MTKLFKYKIGNTGRQSILLPKGAQVLGINRSETFGHKLNLFAVVDPEETEKVLYGFFVVRTGEEMPSQESLGEHIVSAGRFHVFLDNDPQPVADVAQAIDEAAADKAEDYGSDGPDELG